MRGFTDDLSERAAILGRLAQLLNRDSERLAELLPVGPPAHCAALVDRYRAVGVERILFWPLGDEIAPHRRQARRRIPTWAAEATTASATLASEPGAGKRYDGPCTWMAAMTSPSADATGAATDEMPSENSSRTQA